MITPQFELQQFEDYILITIKAPYIKTNDVEIYMEDNEFKFYVKPYFLRLYFPCNIIEDGREKAEYDISTGIFKIEIPKKNLGEHFPNLDMLTTLLATKKEKLFKQIEVVGDESQDLSNSNSNENDGDENTNNVDGVINSVGDNDNNDANDDNDDDDDELNWEVDQELYKPPDLLTGYKYGFANKLSGVFSRLQGELYEVIDISDPDNISPQDRRAERIAEENTKFDPQHYIADLMDDSLIQELIKYQAAWDVEYESILTAYKASYPETSDLINPKGNHMFFTEAENFTFTEEEKKMLLQLPNKDYILNKDEEQTVFLSLVDVIFSYAYNYRTTEGESTSESPWTISKISATLSWMDSFKSPQDVLSSGVRRCLCYPLYRHWLLIQKVVTDVKRIFLLGRRWILRCLLDLHSILQSDENKYILNDLYITDLCIWLQKTKKKKILSICNKLQCIQISKADMNFDLTNVEKMVYDWVEESSGDEEDSSESSDDISSESSMSDVVSSLDSDDYEEDEVINDNTRDALINETEIPSRTEITESKKVCDSNEIEVIRTGLEELVTVQEKFVDGEAED